MSYAFLVTEPMMLPYVLPVEMSNLAELQARAVEVYESKSLIAPVMFIDFDAKKVWRIALKDGNYSLVDSAQKLFGANTRPEQINKEEI